MTKPAAGRSAAGHSAGHSAAVEAQRRRRRGRRRRLLVAGPAFGLAGYAVVVRPMNLPGPSTAWAGAALVAIVLALRWPDGSSRWAAGAAGERATAAALRGVEGEGYTVLHDVRLPGRRWNFDHLLVGPAGVVVIETKQWATPVRVARRRRPSVLRPFTWQVDAVSAALGSELPVSLFLCVHGARVRRRWWARRAAVGNGGHLRRWLRRQPVLLRERDIDDAVRLVRTTFVFGAHGERMGHGRIDRTDRALVERPRQR